MPLLEISHFSLAVAPEKANVPMAHILDDISFTLDKGDTLALVGESGCGKTMTSLAIMGLLPENIFHTGGSILWNGKNITHTPEKERIALRGCEMGMVFQEPQTSLNPVLTIGDQVTEPLICHFNTPKQEAKKQAIELLARVGFPHAANRLSDYPHQLSGGMRQRVMIAMALACKPRLLIADEPTTALDVTLQDQILDLLTTLAAEEDMALLLISHDLQVVAQRANRVGVMYAGSLVELAPSSVFFKAPLHPYSQGLMAASPRKHQKGRLFTIPGTVPSPSQRDVGCPFYSRCSKAAALCQQPVPPQCLEQEGKTRMVACVLYQKTQGPGQI